MGETSKIFPFTVSDAHGQIRQTSHKALTPVTTDRSTTQKHQLKQTVALRAFAPVAQGCSNSNKKGSKGRGTASANPLMALDPDWRYWYVTHDRNSWRPKPATWVSGRGSTDSNGKFDPNVNTKFK